MMKLQGTAVFALAPRYLKAYAHTDPGFPSVAHLPAPHDSNADRNLTRELVFANSPREEDKNLSGIPCAI
jgi:hypothetical protein